MALVYYQKIEVRIMTKLTKVKATELMTFDGTTYPFGYSKDNYWKLIKQFTEEEQNSVIAVKTEKVIPLTAGEVSRLAIQLWKADKEKNMYVLDLEPAEQVKEIRASVKAIYDWAEKNIPNFDSRLELDKISSKNIDHIKNELVRKVINKHCDIDLDF